jgi:hypothetical protein
MREDGANLVAQWAARAASADPRDSSQRCWDDLTRLVLDSVDALDKWHKLRQSLGCGVGDGESDGVDYTR